MTKLLLCGGDRRTYTLARRLAAAGYGVHTCLCDAEFCAPLPTGVAAVILPMPLARGGYLYAPLAKKERPLADVISVLPAVPLFCGGELQTETHEVVNYATDETLAVAGAVATAEGAILTALTELPCTLWQTEVAVFGFGRIGKLLAHRLRGLGAAVTVYARKPSDRMWAEAYGYTARDITDRTALAETRLICNTAPAPLFGETDFAHLRADTLYLELASVPALDLASARAHGLHVITAGGLPGKHFPESAGNALADTLLFLLSAHHILP